MTSHTYSTSNVIIASLTLSALPLSARTALLDMLEKDELLELCSELQLSPRSYSDTHAVAQQISLNEYKTLEIRIEIRVP